MNAQAQLLAGERLTTLAPGAAPANRKWFLQILASQLRGETSLPGHWGLAADELNQLANFLGLECVVSAASELHSEREALRSQLLDLRREEWQQLLELLLQHRARRCASEVWLAKIIASGCLGSGHLWRDLGLAERTSLRQLLEFNFPELARRNTQNMRWKKFFYKQLCEAEGGYVCRAPTCEQCATYQECFGDEL